MNAPNFPALLASITLEKLRAFLAREGWKETKLDGRLNFTKEIEPGEQSTIFVPADHAHPKFRSLLQNMMFSLAVIQQREPAEIASDIVAIQVSDASEATDFGEQLHEIASLVRGLVNECNASEQAKGKILELTRFLLASRSLTIGMTPKLADELWDVAFADKSYLAASTSQWLAANAKRVLAK